MVLVNGNGFSVKEVIETVQQISQRDFLVERAPCRPGDPPILISNSDKARSLLGWKPQYPDLSDLVAHAWQWHQRRHGAAIEYCSVNGVKLAKVSSLALPHFGFPPKTKAIITNNE